MSLLERSPCSPQLSLHSSGQLTCLYLLLLHKLQIFHQTLSVLFGLFERLSLEQGEKQEMLHHRQSVEEDVVLGTDSQVASNEVNVSGDAESVDVGGSHRGRNKASEHGYGGGLAGSVVAQKSCDLAPVHVEIELVYGHLLLLGVLQIRISKKKT